MSRSHWLLLLLVLTAATVATAAAVERPQYILDALAQGSRVFYFGVGSNMLRSKVENRGLNGTKIGLLSMVAGEVRDFRLAFNMKGFPPIEPAMGGIEASPGDSCHGALIEMEAKDYQALWLSEGGGFDKPGYKEIVVDCYRYEHTKPVKCIVLTAAPHVKLARDAPPSERYMNILLEGAKELRLSPTYIDRLSAVRTAKQSSALVDWLVRRHLIFVGWLFRNKLRWVSKALTACLWAVYVPPGCAPLMEPLSEVAMAVVLLPGAACGLLVQLCYAVKGEPVPRGFTGGLQKPREKDKDKDKDKALKDKTNTNPNASISSTSSIRAKALSFGFARHVPAFISAPFRKRT